MTRYKDMQKAHGLLLTVNLAAQRARTAFLRRTLHCSAHCTERRYVFLEDIFNDFTPLQASCDTGL
jgi:hypothetical protein